MQSSSGRFGGALHIFAGERLQAFSDAVFAIIATLMVIPLKLDGEDVEKNGGIEGFDLENFLLEESWPRYLVYLYSFTLVVDMWYCHVGIFSIVEQVDDVIIWLNLLCLMLISFLPYGTGLVSAYPTFKFHKNQSAEDDVVDSEHLAITICALDLLLVGLCMLAILLYAFRKQSLMHPEIESNKDIVTIRRASFISVMITPCMALLALCFSFLTQVPYIALVLFYSIGFSSFFTRLGVYIYYKQKKKVTNLPIHLFNSVSGTSRTEAFSDGLFSIVATLIVLDLTTEEIPSQKNLNDKYGGDLKTGLAARKFVFVSYITSFIAVGLLWFVHYGMMHFIERMTPALSFINKTTLFLIGGIPFISKIDTIFSITVPEEQENDGLNANKAISVRAFCVLLFLTGMGQLLFWTVAHFQKEKCMSSSAEKSSSEGLLFNKIIVFPVISFIIFWGTFSDWFVYHAVDNYLLFITPFIFLLLKAIFKRRELMLQKVKRKLTKSKPGTVNSSADEKTSLMMSPEKGKYAEDDSSPITIAEDDCSPSSTHMRLIGKGEDVQVEVHKQ